MDRIHLNAHAYEKRINNTSKMDINLIIDAAVSKRQAPIITEEKNITFNIEKVAAISQLTNLLNNFQSSTAALKGLKFSEDGVDRFLTKSVSLNSGNSLDPSKYLNISMDSTVSVGTFNVEITQLAQNKVIQSSPFSSKTNITNSAGNHDNTNFFTPGTFNLNNASIIIGNNDSLDLIANKINAVSSTSNVTAKIIRPTTSSYTLILQSILTGVDNDILISDPNSVLNSIYNGSNAIIQEASNSIFVYDNLINVERSSNTVNDFIDGIVFYLISPTSTTVYSPTTTSSTNSSNQAVTSTVNIPSQQPFSISVTIAPNISDTVTAIQDFVNDYNSLIKFVSLQQGRKMDGRFYDEARIQQNQYISGLTSEILTYVSQLTSVEGSTSGIGITFTYEPASDANSPIYNNLLALDIDTLTEALEQNFESVKQLFEFEMTGDTTNFLVYTRGNNITSQTIELDIDITRTTSDIVEVHYNGNTINMTFLANDSSDLTKGGFIKGITGSLMDGYEFSYGGNGVEIANLNISQGLADKIYNTVSKFLSINPMTGLNILQNEISSLIEDNYDKQTYITKQEQSIEKYKTKLIDSYSKAESSIAQADVMETFLKTQLKIMGK